MPLGDASGYKRPAYFVQLKRAFVPELNLNQIRTTVTPKAHQARGRRLDKPKLIRGLPTALLLLFFTERSQSGQYLTTRNRHGHVLHLASAVVAPTSRQSAQMLPSRRRLQPSGNRPLIHLI